MQNNSDLDWHKHILYKSQLLYQSYLWWKQRLDTGGGGQVSEIPMSGHLVMFERAALQGEPHLYYTVLGISQFYLEV